MTDSNAFQIAIVRPNFCTIQPVIVEAEIVTGSPVFTIFYSSVWSGEAFEQTINTNYQDWDGVDADDMADY